MFIETVPEERAEGPLAAYYEQQKAAWGFLPNYRGGVLDPPGGGAGLGRPEQGGARRDGPPPLRDRHHRRRPGAALDRTAPPHTRSSCATSVTTSRP